MIDACGGESDLALRLYWTGRTLVATAGPIDPELETLRARGLRLAVVRWSTGALASAKSTSYAENMGAQDAAIAAGADDALLVAHDGTVLEAPTANVFWREGDRLRDAGARAADPRRRDTRRWCSSSPSARSKRASSRSTGCSPPTRCSSARRSAR